MSSGWRQVVVAVALLAGGLTVWSVRERGQSIDKASALCVVELRAGAASASGMFTLSAPVERFAVAARPGARGERLMLSIGEKEEVFFTGPVTSATEFGCGRGEAGGTYWVKLRQEDGTHGGEVIVGTAPRRAGVTAWQVWSRGLAGLLVASGVWALWARRRGSAKARATSAWLFHCALFGAVMLFSYLLLHEGGHALASMLFGRFDLASSDFWGIHGHPHSGVKAGVALARWQQGLVTFAGPAFPAVVGLGLFGIWLLPAVRRYREARAVANLYASGVVAMSVFAFALLMPVALCVEIADESRGFVWLRPQWLVVTALWGMWAASIYILWRVVPVMGKVFREKAAAMRAVSREVGTAGA